MGPNALLILEIVNAGVQLLALAARENREPTEAEMKSIDDQLDAAVRRLDAPPEAAHA